MADFPTTARTSSNCVDMMGPRINNEIRASSVRLIDEAGEMLGVVAKSVAMDSAQKAGMDLAEVSPNAVPPVCKILDFGIYEHEFKKKKAGAK